MTADPRRSRTRGGRVQVHAGSRRPQPRDRRELVAVLLVAGTVLGGCGPGGSGKAPATPGATVGSWQPMSCVSLTERGAGPTSSTPGGVPAGGDALAEVTLPCFAGGAPVQLGRMPGPAVVNLWASWCPPCRAELPALQRLADRTAGQIRVIGVVTGDSRAAAASLAQDLDLRFPMLWDPEGTLKVRIGAPGLPTTLFVDSGGGVHPYSKPLTDQTLAELAGRHLGTAAS